VSTVPSSDPVTDATFVSAALCFTDIHVDDFNLKDVPNWIDDTYMRNKLNQDLAGKEKCADVSALIKVYLQAGNTIPPSAPAGMQANPREVPQLGGQL